MSHGADDDEGMEQFEMSDYDLEFALNAGKRPRLSKNQQIYGIWADDEGEPSRGFQLRGTKAQSRTANYAAMPVSFVSGGVKHGDRIEPAEEESADAGPVEDIPLPGPPPRKARQDVEDNMPGSANFRHMMAGLRQGGGSHERSGAWERHTKGIGMKLLAKMGYVSGKGLGKEGQGITEPVPAAKRAGRAAVGFYGPEVHRPKDSAKAKKAGVEESLADDVDEGDVIALEQSVTTKGQWRRAAGRQKPKYMYKTVDQLIAGNDALRSHVETAGNRNVVKVIDMTGREQKVYRDYESFSYRSKTPGELSAIALDESQVSSGRKDFDVPELVYNLNLLVEVTAQEIVRTDKQSKYLKDQNVALEHEEHRLSTVIDQTRDEVCRLEAVLSLIEEFNMKAEKKIATLTDCQQLFVTLQRDYYREYKTHALADIAVSTVLPLVKAYFMDWNAFDDVSFGQDMLAAWQELLEERKDWSGGTVDLDDMDPYHRLVWEGWMPVVRRAIFRWQPRDPDCLIALLETWRPLVPHWIVENMLEQVVLPKLQMEVDSWNPRTDTMPIHVWIHPWLPLFGDRLHLLYATIRQKLGAALAEWHPSDKSAKMILQPWVGVFTQGAMDSFMARHVLPRLHALLEHFIINPAHQDLQPWEWLIDWQDMLSTDTLAQLLLAHFFPKWHQVLGVWLANPAANYSEISTWYSGWKRLFPEKLLQVPAIKEQFVHALEAMNRSVSSTGSVRLPPGAKEEVAYLSAAERQKQHQKDYEVLMDARTVTPSAPANFKDLLQLRAQERGIVMIPMANKFYQGRPVWQFGSCLISLDRGVIFVNDGGTWNPIALHALLSRAATT